MPMTKAGTYKGTASERIAKRQKDIDEIGRLSKVVESRTAKKQITASPKKPAVPGSPLPPKKKEQDHLGEKGRGVVQTLKNRTAIEENKMERKEKRK